MKYQYGLYTGNHPVICAAEFAQYYDNLNVIYVKKLRLKKDISFVDFSRFSYTSKRNGEYSDMQIMINQHITCPKTRDSTWLYEQTQLIGNYYTKKFKCKGLRYQTSLIHYEKLDIQGVTPRDLHNYIIFMNPIKCEEYFEEIDCQTVPYSQVNVNLVSLNYKQDIYCASLSEKLKKKPSLELIRFI